MKRWPLAVLAACLLLFATTSPSPAQYGSVYEMRHGTPEEVPLEDVARGFGYDKRAVRTSGNLDVMDPRMSYFRLRETGSEVLILAVPEVFDEMRHLLGREVEVAGLVREVPYRQERCGPMNQWVQSQCENPDLPPLPDLEPDKTHWPHVSITIWSISDLTDFRRDRKRPDARQATLESLLVNLGKRDGQTVRVVGKFRGRNLFGDLPVKSQRRTSDWVIKDDVFAVWITGKKPKGAGWELDASLKRDTAKWIEVVGRPETRGGVVYIRAEEVALTSPPTPTAVVQAPAPPPERPKVPPVVVFTLPIDGEEGVASDSRFIVQFSKDMDEASFEGNVALRYAGPVLPGDRAFDGVKLSYDRGRRALTVDPGDVLRPGREVELLLLVGIKDIDGLALTPRAGIANGPEISVDVIRYLIGG